MPIRESADPELQRSLDLQAGPARSRLSLEGVPLERQISVKFPTIITPSAEAEQIRIDIPGVSAQEAAQHYVGELAVLCCTGLLSAVTLSVCHLSLRELRSPS